MKRRAIPILAAICLAVPAWASPWREIPPGQVVHKGLDISAEALHKASGRYLGTLFDERLKFYRIYQGGNEPKPADRRQVVPGATHFTARPLTQYVHVVRVRITPEQARWLREKGIERQDTIRAIVRFAGIAPGGALAFDLLEVVGR